MTHADSKNTLHNARGSPQGPDRTQTQTRPAPPVGPIGQTQVRVDLRRTEPGAVSHSGDSTQRTRTGRTRAQTQCDSILNKLRELSLVPICMGDSEKEKKKNTDRGRNQELTCYMFVNNSHTPFMN